jgi:hypothetical protein
MDLPGQMGRNGPRLLARAVRGLTS